MGFTERMGKRKFNIDDKCLYCDTDLKNGAIVISEDGNQYYPLCVDHIGVLFTAVINGVAQSSSAQMLDAIS